MLSNGKCCGITNKIMEVIMTNGGKKNKMKI